MTRNNRNVRTNWLGDRQNIWVMIGGMWDFQAHGDIVKLIEYLEI